MHFISYSNDKPLSSLQSLFDGSENHLLLRSITDEEFVTEVPLRMHNGSVDFDLKVPCWAASVHEAVDFDTCWELVQDKVFSLIELRRVVSATTKLNVDNDWNGHARERCNKVKVGPISG